MRGTLASCSHFSFTPLRETTCKVYVSTKPTLKTKRLRSEVRFCYKKYATLGCVDHITIVLSCDECIIVCGGVPMKARGKFPIRQLNCKLNSYPAKEELFERSCRVSVDFLYCFLYISPISFRI